MDLTDTQINLFVDNQLKLPRGKRAEYLKQIDNLIKVLSAKAAADPVINIQKFLKTGSLRKGTVLKPRGEYGVDADIAVFLNAANGSQFDLASLHERLRRLLFAAYPQKKQSDFTIQPRTLGIVFQDSGMEVDLVPILPIEGPGDYGWQPSSQGGPPIKTSVTKQLEFIRARKELYKNFSSLVRLLKHWRNQHELDESLRSFTIELIVSHLQDAEGAPESIQDGLLRFFLFIAQGQFSQPIVFRECGNVTSLPRDRVVILDPVNAENNVTRRLTDGECASIVQKAGEAWEIITAARNNSFQGETVEMWKQVFGRIFVLED